MYSVQKHKLCNSNVIVITKLLRCSEYRPDSLFVKNNKSCNTDQALGSRRTCLANAFYVTLGDLINVRKRNNFHHLSVSIV